MFRRQYCLPDSHAIPILPPTTPHLGQQYPGNNENSYNREEFVSGLTASALKLRILFVNAFRDFAFGFPHLFEVQENKKNTVNFEKVNRLSFNTSDGLLVLC